MIRRVVLALAATVALTACSTFSDNDAVARVNDTEMSTELLDDLTTVIGPQALSPVGTGFNADAARNLITQWIQVAIVDAHLADIGVDVTDDARAEAQTVVDSDPTLTEISDGARDYLLDAQASIITFNQLPDPQGSFESAIDEADVHIDPRYGSFDPQFGVLPLGLGLVPPGL